MGRTFPARKKSRKLSYNEKACNHFKRCDGKPELGSVPRHIKDKGNSKYNQRRFQQAMKRYKAIASAEKRRMVEVKPVSDEIGVGVFAVQNLRPGCRPKELNSCLGGRLSEEKANCHPSALEISGRRRASKRTSSTSTAKKAAKRSSKTSPRYHKLLGPISCLNHACELHANCIPEDRTNDSYDESWSWRCVTVTRYIPAGRELTVPYVPGECWLPCRTCEEELLTARRKRMNKMKLYWS